MRRAAMVALVLLLPLGAVAQEGQRSEWTDCAADADCVVAKGVCNPVAVNARFKSEAETFFADRKATALCVKKFWEPEADQVEARCRLERCEIVGK